MSDDTSAALIASLDVKFDQLANNMKKAITVFDNGGRQLERRQAQIKKNISDWGTKFTGLDGLKASLVGLTAVGIVGGIGALVKSSLDAASAIGDTAQQAGVGVEFLQKLRFAASQSGASFDIMDTALTTLNKNLGDFINTGAGKGAIAFKSLGIDKLINGGQVRNAEQAFDAIASNLHKFGSEAVKSSLLAGVFGKEAGPKLLQLMNTGAEGIAKLEAQAVSLGIVLSTNTVVGAKEASDKLDALGNVIKAQVTGAVTALAPQIAHLADEITKGLPDLILWVERWADWFGLIKLSPVDKLKAQIKDVQTDIASADGLKNSFWTNPLGLMSMNIDAKKGQLLTKLKGLNADLEKAQAARDPRIGAAATPGPKQHIALTAEQIAQAAKRKELLAQTGVDAATASAALLVAQDQTNVQLLKGSADYYAGVQKQINDEYASKVTTAEAEAAKQKATLAKQGTDWKGYATGVANINSALTDKIAAAAEDRKQKLDEAGPGSLVRDALISGGQIIKQYGDETSALGLAAGAAARLAFIQQALNDAKLKGVTLSQENIAAITAEADAVGRAAQAGHEAAVSSQDNIQALDTLRGGLADIAVAGLHGFGSLKDAAGQFLDTLASTILQLYVMKPLLNSLLGESGGSGTGIIGKIFGFADGGVITPSGPRQLKRFAGGGTSRQAAIFGEAGPEAAVPLPDGRRIPVDLRMPAMPQITASGGVAPTIVQNFDLSGAVVTDEIMKRATQAGDNAAAARLSHYDSKILPTRVAALRQQPRLR